MSPISQEEITLGTRDFYYGFSIRKSFKTIENIIDNESLGTALSIFSSIKQVYDNYTFTDRLYSITEYMKLYNKDKHELLSMDKILPLAIDTVIFNRKAKLRDCGLTDLVFISNDMIRKRVVDFVELSKSFDSLNFHIIGRDDESIVKQMLSRESRPNVHYHGMLKHDRMIDVLESCQLNILPSRSEGFPRGIIECAAIGIPTITYADYGAAEWISNYDNGLVCSSLKEIEKAIERFINDPVLLKNNSMNALKLAKQFGGREVTKMYEEVIKQLYYES